MKRIFLVVGARPNFVKAAPLYKSLREAGFSDVRIIHTGQHYDFNMSDVFFRDLDLPSPDVNLEVGSGSHGKQTGEMLIKLDDYFSNEKPDLVVVFGDTNSTLAGALAAVKLGIKIAHVEAGARSFDLKMPEEINRILTDRVSDLLFVPDEYAKKNLLMEGIPAEKVFNVGNILMDTLINSFSRIEQLSSEILERFKVSHVGYGVVTIHRAHNVDNSERLIRIIDMLNRLSSEFVLIFPVHPRTLRKIKSLDVDFSPNIKLVEPLGYLEFVALLKNAAFVLTDSGGVQTESYFLNVPCLTLRENTEWLSTIDGGTNFLVGFEWQKIQGVLKELKDKGYRPKKKEIPYWDGRTSDRIVSIIKDFLNRGG